MEIDNLLSIDLYLPSGSIDCIFLVIRRKLLLQLENIGYTPPNFIRPLLSDISFTVAAGETISIAGITGAGKSSLLRLLNRLQDPSAGRILFNGTDYRQLAPIELRQQIVLVPQEPKLLGMKVRQALAYPLELRSLARTEIERRILAITELLAIPSDWFDRTEAQLSLGERQLIAIARGLMLEPQLLLLDEPILNLDLITAERVLSIVNNLTKSRQMGTIVVNGRLELAARFSDRSLYLKAGRLLWDRSASSIDWQDLAGQIRTAERQSLAEWDE